LFTKNAASEDTFRKKYTHLYFRDTSEEESEVRRIVDVEWREKQPGKKQPRAQYQVVCQLVAKSDEKYEGDEDLCPYMINEALHEMILECPEPYNQAFQLIQPE
jgi:hypothetical protein